MTHRIAIVVFDGVTLLDASGPADVLRLADPQREYYQVEFVSVGGGSVVSSAGLKIADTKAAVAEGAFDTVLIAGGDALVDRTQNDQLLQAVQQLTHGADRVASVCTGAFVLAALGYLDGRRATTHWRHIHTLMKWYPRIRVEPDVLFVQDGRYLTSAGISAGIDLTLAIVEHDLGAGVARDVAREMVVFMQRPGGQSQFSNALSHPIGNDERLRRVLDTVTADPAGEHTVTSMAAMIGVSVRHLHRIFSTELGSSPSQWLEQVRVDTARALLLEGLPITKVAQLCGLGSDETLRRAFARQLGITPTAFRDRFSTTG